MKLVRVEKELAPNTVAFEPELKFSKPEIKQYLEKSNMFFKLVYGLNVLKVNTLIRMGKIRNKVYSSLKKRDPDIKRAYVSLDENIPDFYKYIK